MVGGGVVVVVVGGGVVVGGRVVVVVCLSFFFPFLSLLGFLVALGFFGSLFFFLSFFFFLSSSGALLTLPKTPGKTRKTRDERAFPKLTIGRLLVRITLMFIFMRELFPFF